MNIKLNELKTGMKVQTLSGKFYYVIEDWVHRDPEANMVGKCNAVLFACDPADTQRFYGLTNHDENGKLWGLEDNEWNIEKVFVFCGPDLDEMGNPEHESEWMEVIKPLKLDQEFLQKYFAKFD